MKKRNITVLGAVSITIILILLIGKLICMVNSINANTDFTVESLRWTMIGAIGSWAGSVFGAIALVISIMALALPQKVKIKVEVSTGFFLSQLPSIDRVDAYIIMVKNISMKPVTVKNVYLHFGDKKQGDIFVGALNLDSVLQSFTHKFPVRLDQGESFEYYLLRDKLNTALEHYEEKTPLSTPFSIRVDEVTTGTKYYKTKWTLNNFLHKE